MRGSLAAECRKRWLRPVLAVMALTFAAVTVLYNVLWMTTIRQTPQVPPVEFGFDFSYLPDARAFLVTAVKSGSPAERAGMREGDRIVAIEDARVRAESSLFRAYRTRHPGDRIEFTAERPGQAQSVTLAGVLRLRRSGPLSSRGWQELPNTVPVPFVVVGLTVLFLRLEDRNAWLLALLFASFATVVGLPRGIRSLPPALSSAAIAYYVLFLGLLGGLFYFFFAVFPTRSPIDRRIPWLKWAALAAGLALALPGIRSGAMWAPAPLSRLLGDSLSQRLPFWYEFSFLALGLASLTANFFGAQEPQARRKLRVIFAGTAVGVGPPLVEAAAENFAGFHPPLWLASLVKSLLFLLPLSFAYAVVKHRVLEIPVLLKMSARYLMVQRGFTIVLGLMSVVLTLLFAVWSAPKLEPLIQRPSRRASPLALHSAPCFCGVAPDSPPGERQNRPCFLPQRLRCAQDPAGIDGAYANRYKPERAGRFAGASLASGAASRLVAGVFPRGRRPAGLCFRHSTARLGDNFRQATLAGGACRPR